MFHKRQISDQGQAWPNILKVVAMSLVLMLSSALMALAPQADKQNLVWLWEISQQHPSLEQWVEQMALVQYLPPLLTAEPGGPAVPLPEVRFVSALGSSKDLNYMLKRSRFLGQGNQSSVYGVGRWALIKWGGGKSIDGWVGDMYIGDVTSDNILRRSYRAWRRISQLNSPYVLSMNAAFSESRVNYFVVEQMDGDLEGFVRRKDVQELLPDLPEELQVLEGAASGAASRISAYELFLLYHEIEFAKEQYRVRIDHNDIKPANVFYRIEEGANGSRRVRFKLADFGISYCIEDGWAYE